MLRGLLAISGKNQQETTDRLHRLDGKLELN